MQQSDSKPTPRKTRTIVVDFNQAEYELNISDASYFRSVLDSSMERYPELFPFELQYGYQMKDLYLSKKLSINIRRIKVTIEGRVICFTIRPSFIMPYLTGMAVEYAVRQENSCIGCGVCARFCPEKAISLQEGLRRVFVAPPQTCA